MGERHQVTIVVQYEDNPHAKGQLLLSRRVAAWAESSVERAGNYGVVVCSKSIQIGAPTPAPDHRADVERGLRGAEPD